jgi:WD40 repeat protein
MWVQRVPGGGVTSLAYLPDSSRLLTLDRGGWVTSWDVAGRRGRRVFQLPLHDRYGGIRSVAVAGGGRFLVAQAYTTRVWDLETGTRHGEVSHPFSQFSPRLDATGRFIVVPASQDRELIGWDVAACAPGPVLLRAAPGTVDRLGRSAFAPDSRTAAVLTARQELVIYDLTGGPEVARFDHPFTEFGVCVGLDFTANGRYLVLRGPDTLRVWETASYAVRFEARGVPWSGNLFALHPAAPAFAALDADGVLTLFGLETGQPIRSLDFALGKRVTCAAFAPDGMTCAAGGSNKQFAVFDVDL